MPPKRTGYTPDTDGSRPARKRTVTLAVTEFKTPDTTPGREDRRPDTDWTGIQYKTPAECIKAGIDYSHTGRESTAGRGKE